MNLKIIPCLLFLSACVAVNVQPLATERPVQHICIVKNGAVTIGDFAPTVQERLQYHGVLSIVIEDNNPLGCEYQLRYTARRSWNITSYLSRAELTLWYEGKQIAKTNYHLRGKNGLSLVKWASALSKMDPVIDALLDSQAVKKQLRRRQILENVESFNVFEYQLFCYSGLTFRYSNLLTPVIPAQMRMTISSGCYVVSETE